MTFIISFIRIDGQIQVMLYNRETSTLVKHVSYPGTLIKSSVITQALVSFGIEENSKVYLHKSYCNKWAMSYLSLLKCEVIPYTQNTRLPKLEKDLINVIKGLTHLPSTSIHTGLKLVKPNSQSKS